MTAKRGGRRADARRAPYNPKYVAAGMRLKISRLAVPEPGLSSESAAELAGVAPGTWRGWETGEKPVNVFFLDALHEIYGFDANYIVYGTKSRLNYEQARLYIELEDKLKDTR